jgi:hypothetical protein
VLFSSAGSVFGTEFGTQSGNAVFLLRNIHCFDFVVISRPKKALFGVSDLKSPLRFACEIVWAMGYRTVRMQMSVF